MILRNVVKYSPNGKWLYSKRLESSSTTAVRSSRQPAKCLYINRFTVVYLDKKLGTTQKGQIVIKFLSKSALSKHRNKASVSEVSWLEMKSEDDKCLQPGTKTLALLFLRHRARLRSLCETLKQTL